MSQAITKARRERKIKKWRVYPEPSGRFCVAEDRGGTRKHGTSITGWGNVTQTLEQASLIAAAPDLYEALKAMDAGFKDGSIRFSKKRQADEDPYHPANTLMCAALARVEESKMTTATIQNEVDGLSAELAANHAKLTTESQRVAELREAEIVALMEHCEVGSDPRFCDVFCDWCPEQITIQGTTRELAEMVFANSWMVYHESPLCPACQEV